VVEGARVFEVRPQPVALESVAHETGNLAGGWLNHLNVDKTSYDCATGMWWGVRGARSNGST
jgi:hypothetical protein